MDEGCKLIPRKNAIESEKQGKQILRKRETRCGRRGQTDEEKGKQMMKKKATIDAEEEGH